MAFAESHPDPQEVDDVVLLVQALVVTLREPNGQVQGRIELMGTRALQVITMLEFILSCDRARIDGGEGGEGEEGIESMEINGGRSRVSLAYLIG